jgi:KDO2-lipid IV(A) lauroyltransferase
MYIAAASMATGGSAMNSKRRAESIISLTLLVSLFSGVFILLSVVRRPRQRLLLHEGFLCRLELGLYYVIIVPLIAFLPAFLAYGIACLQGSVRLRLDRKKREYIMQGLKGVFDDQMSYAERLRVTRDYFRVSSCEAVDAWRLLGKGRALTQLVEVRGLEHLEAALAAGKGAILCGAHFGSYITCSSLIGAKGFPITVVGRTPNKLNKNRTFIERIIFNLFFLKPLVGHWQRPNIQPRGQIEVAFEAAKILRHNELIGILIDPPVLPVDRARAIRVKFLNGQALLLPGMTTIAQLTGAPVLMTFMRRTEDWRHQILEISPPVPMDGDPLTAFGRCLAMVEAAIRQNPSHWHYWGKNSLIGLGLLPEDYGSADDDCKIPNRSVRNQNTTVSLNS